MIIEFNPNVFIKEQVEILSEIFVFILKSKDRHFVETKGIRTEKEEYIFQIPLFHKEIAARHIEELIKHIPQQRRSISSLHKKYLTRIVIGFGNDEILPQNALRILQQPSKIILENLINDWKFLKGICDKYTDSPKRKTIYLLVQKAIRNEWIEPATGGGDGQIKPAIQHYINSTTYQGIEKYKLMALFDSDRQLPNTDKLDTTKIPLVYYLKTGLETSIPTLTFNDCTYEANDLIIWHILYKRKIENYVPLSVLFNCIYNLTEQQKQYLQSLSSEQLDFEEYTKDKINIGNSKIKEQFPQMFLSDFSYQEFEKRCEHHKIGLENISEMEQILLKIAKII
jgi:hypothetical protein